MTLEKINDDLVEFLPYEIDDTYIEKLFCDITNLKIRSKYSIPFYENIKDQYEILVDQKGPVILKEMVEYYYNKNKDLSINTSILLNYFGYYASDLDMELKTHDVSNFIDDFKMQSNCTNYFSYVKYRLERMQLKRFTDPNYLYSEARDLSYFEEYLSNIIEFDLESNEKTYEYSIDFARKISKKKNYIFKEESRSYENKLYELKKIFLEFNSDDYSFSEMKQIYGSLFSIVSRDFIPFLCLIRDEGYLTDTEQEHYEGVIDVFKNIRKKLISKIGTIDYDNYKEKLKEIETEYGINYSKVCMCKRLSQDLEKKISTKNGRIDMLEYSLQSQVSLKEVVDIAHGLKRDSEAEIIDAYIKKYEVDFELYHKDDCVGKINCNGRVFGEDEEKQLEKYLKREKLPSLVGVVMPVIYKILNDEELPSRNYQSKKKLIK